MANTLSDEGEEALILDKNEESFRRLSPSYGGLSVVGDGMDLEVLRSVRISEANTLVVVTNNDNVNVMIALLARELFGVKNVIARLYDPERECVYKELNIGTICPAVLSAHEIDKLLARQEEVENA